MLTNDNLATKLHKYSKYPGGSPNRARSKCAPKSHVWIRNAAAHHDMSENMFECLRCAKWYKLPADGNDKLEKIRQFIPVRFKTKNDSDLCRLVQEFFYKFSNEENTIRDLLGSIENSLADINRTREHGKLELTSPVIVQQVRKIIDFLVEFRFLSHGTSLSQLQSNNPLMVSYIHRNQTDWK